MPLYTLTPRESIPLFVGIARNSLQEFLAGRPLRVSRSGYRTVRSETEDFHPGGEFMRLRAMGWEAGLTSDADIPATELLELASIEAATPVFTVGVPPNSGGFARNKSAILAEYRSFLESVHYTPDQITAELSRYRRNMTEVSRIGYTQNPEIINADGRTALGNVCLVPPVGTWHNAKFTHLALLGARTFVNGRFTNYYN